MKVTFNGSRFEETWGERVDINFVIDTSFRERSESHGSKNVIRPSREYENSHNTTLLQFPFLSQLKLFLD